MYEPIQVEWVDSTAYTETWYSLEEALDKRLTVAKTIGYLLLENEDGLTICQSYGTEEEDREVGGLFMIPKGCIKRIKQLKEKA